MAAPYAWEVESDSEHDGPDGGDVYACMSAEDAAAELVELRTFLKHSGKLPAIYASQIAWFASRAGAVDATLAKMGLPPGRQSGAYSRKLDRAIDIDLATEHEWYEVGVPTYGKYEGVRSITQLKVINPHDVLAAEFNTPAARAKLAAATLPPSCEGHPARAAAGGDHVFRSPSTSTESRSPIGTRSLAFIYGPSPQAFECASLSSLRARYADAGVEVGAPCTLCGHGCIGRCVPLLVAYSPVAATTSASFRDVLAMELVTSWLAHRSVRMGLAR